MTYHTGGLWPSSADGNGYSLVPVNPNSNPNPELPSSWRISTFTGGSPFADDTGPTGPLNTQYAAVAANLKITEIMYNPASGGVIDGDEFEFLEFKNIGSSALNLTGVIIEDAVNYVFPSSASALAAGGFWIVASNSSMYSTRYTSPAPSGAYSGKLSDTGERIAVVDPRGNVLINVTYDQNSPWPGPAGSGVGFSLVPVNPTAPGVASDPASWRASTKINGTPFADDTGPTGPLDTTLLVLKVTEIMYGARQRGIVKGSEYEFVEVKNTGSASIDLSGSVFATGIYEAMPQNTNLASGQFLVLASNSTEFNSRYGRPPSFQYRGALSDSGEKLTINDRNGNSVLSFTYNNTAPWLSLNGTDYSLVPVQPNSNPDPSDPANWRRSTNQGGSPFADDPTAPTSLIATTTSAPATSATATSVTATSGLTSGSSTGAATSGDGVLDAGEKVHLSFLPVYALILLKLVF
jgi:hypothetical protein